MKRALPFALIGAVVIAVAPPFWLGLLNAAGIAAILALGLVVLTGVAGITSFGQATFMGFGAYAAAFVAQAGFSPWLGLGGSIVAALAAALVIGVATLRLSGHFLALATIAWSVALVYLAGALEITGRNDGLTGLPPVPLPGAPTLLAAPRPFAVLVWIMVGLCGIGVLRLLDSRVGRSLRALRGAPGAAAACGVDLWRARLIAFLVAAGLAGLAGWLHAHDLRAVNPSPFGLHAGIVALLVAVLGGIGHVGGAVLGALAVTLIDDRLQSALPGNADAIVFGALLVLLLQVAPDGLWPLLTRWRSPRAAPRAVGVPPPARAPVAAGTTLLAATRLRRAFGGLVAVDGVSLSIAAGELVALIGPNGAGKSTTFDLLSGTARPDSGALAVSGRPSAPLTPRAAARAGIARTFQHARLAPGLSVIENVALGAHLRGRAGVFRAGLRRDRAEEAALFAAAAAALARVGLADAADRPAPGLPLGQQRLVEIARALAADPALLLLDEPAAGLRAAERAPLATLLAKLRRDGLGILLVEHDMAFVMALADRVVVLDFGRVIAEGPPAAIRVDPVVIAAYLGTAA